LGCRISACGDPEARWKNFGKCGHPLDMSVATQCAAQSHPSSKLYHLDDIAVIGVHIGCQYQYIPHPASSPMCCRIACEASERCKVFSFSSTQGCRLSACAEKLAVNDGSEQCGKASDSPPAVSMQCQTVEAAGSYLYSIHKTTTTTTTASIVGTTAPHRHHKTSIVGPTGSHRNRKTRATKIARTSTTRTTTATTTRTTAPEEEEEEQKPAALAQRPKRTTTRTTRTTIALTSIAEEAKLQADADAKAEEERLAAKAEAERVEEDRKARPASTRTISTRTSRTTTTTPVEVHYEELEEPPEQPPPLEEHTVDLFFKVGGVHYAGLAASGTLAGPFEQTLQESIVEQCGGQLLPKDVRIQLSSGSVAVHAIIMPPAGVSTSAVKLKLATSEHMERMTERIVTGVRAIHGIEAVSTGKIGVSHMSTQKAKANASATKAITLHLGDRLEVRPGYKLRMRGEEFYKEGDVGSVTKIYRDDVCDACLEIMWDNSGLTSTIAVIAWSDKFKFVEKAIHLNVGDRLEVLPGKDLVVAERDLYREGDEGSVSKQYTSESGEGRLEISWVRTGLTSTIGASSWSSQFKLVAKAPRIAKHIDLFLKCFWISILFLLCISLCIMNRPRHSTCVYFFCDFGRCNEDVKYSPLPQAVGGKLSARDVAVQSPAESLE